MRSACLSEISCCMRWNSLSVVDGLLSAKISFTNGSHLSKSLNIPLSSDKLSRCLGVHTGIGGGLHHSIAEAKAKGCQTWQIFSRNPRGWATRPLTNEEIKLFRNARDEAELTPCVIHACYLVNLATG